MKKGINLLLLALLFITPGCQQPKEVVNVYNIVPLPNHLTPQQGRFELNKKVKVITTGCTPEVAAIADSLIQRLAMISGIRLQHAEQADAGAAITFVTQEGLSKEGYKLSVTPQQITITASQPNGFFYAMQSLYQLLPPAVYGQEKVKNAEWSVPAVEIEDSPRFSYRGLHLDVCRHFPSLDYIYKYIDMLAMHKMNTFHWHLTDDQGWRIEIKKYPKLTEIGSKRKGTLIDYYFVNYPQVFDNKEVSGYYTQEEVKAVVAYAASKYITVIPEIEMPGHAIAALAAYPELSCRPDTTYEVTGLWGVFEEVFCPKEETFAFLEGVMDEVIELFPSEYIHVGGDECPKTVWKNCKHCQDLIKSLGLKDDTTPNVIDGLKHSKEDKLQSYFITRMEKYINSKGRRIIGWDEILEGGLAPNATVMSWRGVEGGINAAKAGHDAIMTPGAYAYLDKYQEDPEFAPTTIGGFATLKFVYAYNPVPDDADELVKKHIIGLQGNCWAEYMKTDDRRDYQVVPRGVAIAETGWTQNANKSWDDFCQRMVSDFDRMEVLNVKPCTNFFDVNIYTQVGDNDSLNVVLESYYPGAEIRYTIDETDPTATSELYTQPFGLDQCFELRAAAFKDGKKLGSVNRKSLYGNLISGKKYTVTPQAGWVKGDIIGPNEALGEDPVTLGLTNGRRGNGGSYIPWTCFNMNGQCKEVVFTVQMDKPTLVSEVLFGSLFNPAYCILPAGSAFVEISADGKDYKKVAEKTITRNLPKTGRIAYTDILTFEPVEATYIRLTIGNGGTLQSGVNFRPDVATGTVQANLYLDEVEVY